MTSSRSRATIPFSRLDNVILTPHLGYATAEAYRAVYSQSIEAIRGFLDKKPVRTINKLA